MFNKKLKKRIEILEYEIEMLRESSLGLTKDVQNNYNNITSFIDVINVKGEQMSDFKKRLDLIEKKLDVVISTLPNRNIVKSGINNL